MTRQLYTGDNLQVMETLESDSIDLIYLDPPFNSNRDYGAFDDKWKEANQTHIDELSQIASIRWLLDCARNSHSVSMSNYLAFMGIRLLELNRLLKDNGSIYLHIDPTASHYLKVMMDAIFGVKSFRNEIVWSYKKWANDSRFFQRNSDHILFYAMGDYTFNKQYDYIIPEHKLKGWHSNTYVEDGVTICQLIIHDWDKVPKKRLENPKYNVTIDMSDRPKELPLGNVWNLPMLGSGSNERCGYPTQKPLKLLERIILASSNQGDLILDPFCGSGTALIAAERFGRQYIGIDKNDNYKILEDRMIQQFGELMYDIKHTRL